MPNATCFLIAYLLVLVIESVRFVISGESLRQWLTRVSLGMFLLAFLTHTLYLADLVIQGIWYEQGFRYLKTWGDWSIAAALPSVQLCPNCWRYSSDGNRNDHRMFKRFLSFRAWTKYITPEANPKATRIVPMSMAIEWTIRQKETVEVDLPIGLSEGNTTARATSKRISGSKNRPICLSLRR